MFRSLLKRTTFLNQLNKSNGFNRNYFKQSTLTRSDALSRVSDKELILKKSIDSHKSKIFI